MANLFKSSAAFALIASALIISSSALAQGRPAATGIGSTNRGVVMACQARESAISKRLSQLIKLSDDMMTKFDSIAQRVEKYYTDKVVPQGKTVSNYNGLVSDINAKKLAVQNTITKASSDTQSFNCSSNPKDQLNQFRVDMQNVKQALKAYRTSIKNLIVAIATVTGTAESTKSATEGGSR